MSVLCQSLKRAALEKQLSFISPAKINLFFQVLHKRDDGFHEIASLYQAISLYDLLYFSLSQKDEMSCSDPNLPMDQRNLIVKALQAFREKTGNHHPLKIHVEKKIPMEAGLGGGSSNAATTLFALSTLFSIHFSREELIEMGSRLGSDVPFFFSSGTAYCTGRGEKLQEVVCQDFLQGSCLWIAKPEMGLSTALVYQACKPDQMSKKDPLKNLTSFSLGRRDFFFNDLEQPAFFLSHDLKRVKDALLSLGFDQVVMSGSGTAFFCIGKIKEPYLEGVFFTEVSPIHKKNTSWYEI